MKVYDRSTDAISARPGERFAVDLESLPAAGYEWAVTVEGPAARLLRAEPGRPGAAVGAQTVDRFVFEATGAGQAVLRLSYGRPWEEKPAELFALDVHVMAQP